MPDIDQIIDRIEGDLNQIEAAQKVVKETAEAAKVLQESAAKVVEQAEKDLAEISEDHRRLIESLSAIVAQLEGFDFPDLKQDLLEIRKQIQEQGALDRQKMDQLEGHINKVSQLTEELRYEFRTQMENQQTWIDLQFQMTAQNIAQFRQSQEKRQRNLQTWIFVLLVFAFLSIGLLVFNLLRAQGPAVQQANNNEKEPIVQIEQKKAASSESLNTAPKPIPPSLLSPGEAQREIQIAAANALNRIKSQSFDRLAEKYWDPKGVEFFPFGMTGSGKKFSREELKTAPTDGQTYLWGNGPDGTAVNLSFPDYFQQFVNDQDYLNAQAIHYNEITFPGRSNLTLEALARHFGPSFFVEYVIGEKSLVLVFGETKQVKGVVSGS